jgi:hypothetical protein
MLRGLPTLLLLGLLAGPACAQPRVDTTVTWRSYSQTGTTEVRVYPGPPDEEETHTIVLREVAENRGPSTVEDLPYLADLVGRQLGIDPTAAYWVLHWGGFSFEGGDPGADKALYLEATFNRTNDGDLGSPRWDVISETELRELTDRRWSK